MKTAKQSPGLLAILAYDGLCTFEYAIAVEVFALVRPGLGVPWYRTVIVSADEKKIRGLGGVVIEPSGGLATLAKARTIIIPGWRESSPTAPKPLVQALHKAAHRNARFLSICSGAFLLGAAGLLDGRRATTHWLYGSDFQRAFPRTRFEENVLYIDEGNVITSAGSAAGIDACLHLVRRDYGARVANLVARRMVVPPHREGGQAQYVEAPVSVQPQRSISNVFDWARKRLAQPIAIGDLVEQTPLSSRTFLRRFNEAVGMTPHAWLQRERMVRARQLLESTTLALTEVGEQCGYQSSEAFRIAFKRTVGIPPHAYRRQFRGEFLRSRHR